MKPLRIAIPKGRLLDATLARFADGGFEVPDAESLRSRSLVFSRGGVEWIFVKDGDVPTYVEFGAADAGVAGLDQLLERRSDVMQPLAFDFGRCRMMLIGTKESAPIETVRRAKLATKYPNIARTFAMRRAVDAEIVALQGSVELAAVLDLAPYIVDLVETGETMRVHGLVALETIAEITPRLIINRNAYRLRGEEIRALIARLDPTARRAGALASTDPTTRSAGALTRPELGSTDPITRRAGVLTRPVDSAEIDQGARARDAHAPRELNPEEKVTSCN